MVHLSELGRQSLRGELKVDVYNSRNSGTAFYEGHYGGRRLATSEAAWNLLLEERR